MLVLPSEGSAGVLGCPSTPSGVIVGWQGTAGVERRRSTAEQSAEAKVPAGSMVAGRAEREADAQDARARGMDDDRSQPPRGVLAHMGAEGEARSPPSRAQSIPGAG